MTQAEGVYNQRLQNLAVTLDKVVLPPTLLCLFNFVILVFLKFGLRALVIPTKPAYKLWTAQAL